MIEEAYVGMPFRQLAQRLRIQRGRGLPDLVSERPRHKESKRFLDADNPTLITFDEHCQVSVQRLLDIGAIEPWEVPAAQVVVIEANGDRREVPGVPGIAPDPEAEEQGEADESTEVNADG